MTTTRIFAYRVCTLKRTEIQVGSIFDRRIREGWSIDKSIGSCLYGSLFHSLQAALKFFKRMEEPNLILFFDPFNNGSVVSIIERIEGKEKSVENTLVLRTTQGVCSQTIVVYPDYIERSGSGLWDEFEESLKDDSFLEIGIVTSHVTISGNERLKYRKVMRKSDPQGAPYNDFKFW